MNLLKLLGRPITFHRVFVDVAGSINAALMLSNAVYWTNKLPSEREGWFHKSRDEWTAETGLTRYEQEKARETLERMGLLETRRAKLPNAECVTGTWFRVNVEAMTAALSALSDSTKGGKPAFPKSGKPADQKRETRLCSPFRSKNINYPTETPPPRERAREISFSLPDDWQPKAATVNLLIADSIPPEFIAKCLPEFGLYWQTRADLRTDPQWQTAFIRQVRHEYAFQTQQASRHDQRQNLPGRPQSQPRHPRKESVAERCERYERYANGLDASISATERARNARKTDGDAIVGEFTRH